MFLEIVNKHASLKQYRVKKTRQSGWLTPKIIDTMKERDRCKINGLMEQCKNLRNTVTLMIKTAKQEIYKLKLDEDKDDIRSIWKLFREFGAEESQVLQKIHWELIQMMNLLPMILK